MYGTFGRMTPKDGKRDELIAMVSAPRRRGREGLPRRLFLKADEATLVVAVMYDDKDAYFAMVHDPQTDENFGKIMELLEGEPTWTDGEWLGPRGPALRKPVAASADDGSPRTVRPPRCSLATVAPGLGYAPRSWPVERSSSSIW